MRLHPHGDASVYDAMVVMAQDFKERYPLIDIHGNIGSVDGDPAAAMRYTEGRLSKFGDLMLKDIDKNTVDFAPNFDGEEQEPSVLPSRYPNLLVNGSSGIAVGMAVGIYNIKGTILTLISAGYAGVFRHALAICRPSTAATNGKRSSFINFGNQ